MAANPVKPRRIVRVLDGLWYAGSAPQTLMLLTALLAGTLALAAIIPQQPAGLTGAVAEQWLTGATSSYRQAGSFLRAVGAFHITSSPWMRALLAALALNLTLRVAAQAGFLRRLWRSPRPLNAPPRLIVHRAAFPGLLDTLVNQSSAALRSRFSLVAVDSDPERAQVYAVRRPEGAAGPLLTYFGPLLILLGLLLNDTLGWRVVNIALAPGGSTSLPTAEELRVTLANIGGEQKAPAALRLTGAHADKEILIAENRPARLGSVWLSQQEIGPALAVTAADSNGRPVGVQALTPGGEVTERLQLLFQQTQGEQAFALPARNLTFRVVSYPGLPERNITAPVFLVEAYRGADPTPVFEKLVEDTAAVNLDGVVLTLHRDRYVVLEAAALPGLPLLLFGAIITLAGAITSAAWSPARAWVGLAADGDAVDVAVRAAVAAEPERELARLLTALRPAPAAVTETTDAG
jgi:cytochrome c biogenesis protein ResB